MCLVFLCSDEETVLGNHKAPGSCPFCGSDVVATDVERSWRLCFVPLCFRVKRKFSCSVCRRRLATLFGLEGWRSLTDKHDDQLQQSWLEKSNLDVVVENEAFVDEKNEAFWEKSGFHLILGKKAARERPLKQMFYVLMLTRKKIRWL
ncbi:hypothetical protein HPP92_027669 [Vanilla planifolia]|uniref:Uncharacterized protein n=1 Tax=Vanilla planifolia TaxID=51239 RepID=A0A835PE51_VANPL|nr:hypothetical protein HPP92_027669 [Vanilla planifolia]